MKKEFFEGLENSPVIAAIKNKEELDACLTSDIKVIFVLFGDICNICEIIDRIKATNRMVLIHIDLIIGLSAKEISVDYIYHNTKADGIISTKLNLVNRAKELGMHTVYRVFMIDSMALNSLYNQNNLANVDVIEILPGVLPRIIKKLKKEIKCPIIAGGLISNKQEVIEALEAGAISISSTNKDVWFM